MWVANSVCHMSHCKWSKCQNATAVSQVTPPDESIEMVQYRYLINLYIFAKISGGRVRELEREALSVDGKWECGPKKLSVVKKN